MRGQALAVIQREGEANGGFGAVGGQEAVADEVAEGLAGGYGGDAQDEGGIAPVQATLAQDGGDQVGRAAATNDIGDEAIAR